jgi:hypothetical protein
MFNISIGAVGAGAAAPQKYYTGFKLKKEKAVHLNLKSMECFLMFQEPLSQGIQLPFQSEQ